MSLVGDEVDLYSQYPYLTTDEGEVDLYEFVEEGVVDLYQYVDLGGEVDPYAIGKDIVEVDPYAIGKDIVEVDPYAIGKEVCSIDSDCSPGDICKDGLCVEGIQLTVVEDTESCKSNSDCPLGQVCQNGSCADYSEKVVGALAKPKSCYQHSDCPLGQICSFEQGYKRGVCISVKELPIAISGVLDDRTCPYCRSQIGKTGFLDMISLPPYHKHCRCSWRFISL
jgi:Cys-rich repeat protein